MVDCKSMFFRTYSFGIFDGVQMCVSTKNSAHEPMSELIDNC